MKSSSRSLTAVLSLTARSPAILFAALMVPLVWALFLLNSISEKESSLRQAKLHTSNVVQIFEENTERIFLGLDRSLRMLRLLYENDPTSFDLNYWADNAALIAGNAIQFSLIGPDGYMFMTTTNYVGPRLYLGDREHFINAAALATDDVYIGSPVIGRASRKWSIQVTRKLRAKDGSFAGVIVGSIDPDQVGKFYETAQLGINGSVVLRNANNVILAARGLSVTAIGQQANSAPLAAAVKQARSGFFWGSGAVDGISRLVAYRHSSSLPLILTVGESEQEIFSTYRYHQKVYFILAVLLSTLLVVAAYLDFQHRLTRLRAENELKSVKNFLDTVIQSIPMPIGIKDVNTRKFVFVNRAYEAFLGRSRQNILNTTLFEHFPTDVAKKISSFDTEALEMNRAVSNEFPLNTKAAGSRVVTTSRLVVRDNDQQPRWLLSIVDDITERKNSEAKIEHLAHYDMLTNLANRNLFKERIDECVARLMRMGAAFAVFQLDLDRFKAVNDSFGHQDGDVLLKEAANRIKGSIREVDLAARLGGDEFALLVMPGLGDLREGAENLAARLIEVIGAPYTIGGREVVIGCSIGIALAPEHGDKRDELLKNADLALYKSKNSGRNCFNFYDDSLKTEADGRNELENDLRQAIWHEEFELFYQPIVATQTGRIEELEALVRWRHPTKGMITPNQFIPLAEETGLITQIGEWVLNRACYDAMQMPAYVRVAVNLSPAQFSKTDVLKTVVLALDASGLSPGRLELEITESVLLKETEQNIRVLRELKDLGVGIVLDDFGVGYSSLGYLTAFPFNRVKIDRSFVSRLNRPETKAVVMSIVSLSRSLKLTTCAEGVETQAQLAEIKAIGIDLSQGYLFGRPSPLADLDFRHASAIDVTKAA